MTEEQISKYKQMDENPTVLLKDWAFEALVASVNVDESQISITLTLAGQVITGYLIGVREYFDGVLSAAQGSKFYQSYHNFKESHYSIEALKELTDNAIMADFFHLKEAKFINTPNNPFPDSGAYFRGKVSQVDGFMFGTMTVRK